MSVRSVRLAMHRVTPKKEEAPTTQRYRDTEREHHSVISGDAVQLNGSCSSPRTTLLASACSFLASASAFFLWSSGRRVISHQKGLI
jgi:hypothetical protein